jgi:hypothetical protein
MKRLIKVDMNGSYKLGMDEVMGLRSAMIKAFQPVLDVINDKVYWGPVKFEDAEYKSRDGFRANSSNCGGIVIDLIIPKCEECEFDYLEFGEYDCGEFCSESECTCDQDGGLDARLRIWFKFEGLEDGTLNFYINACGGNGDAPYFRIGNLSDIFEATFTAKSIEGISRAASKHVKKLLSIIK